MSYFDSFRAARKVPMQAWVETSFAPTSRQDPLTEDEASDEESDMDEMRHQAKGVSHGIVASGCLPSDATRPASRQSCSTNMMMLSEAAVLLKEITTRPCERQYKTWNIWQKLQAEDLLPGTDSKVESCSSRKPSPSKTATCMHESDSSGKQTSPTKRSAARRRSEALEAAKTAAKTAEFFCMDTGEDDPMCRKAARDSSLARGYDALGVTHYALEDDSVSEPSNATQGRESSIDRCYDALGASTNTSSERRGSRAGDLQPVRAPSRQRQRSQRPLCAAPSAMDLDLGLCTTATKGIQHDSRTPSPTVQKRQSSPTSQKCQSQSVGAGVRVTKSNSKNASSLTLPRLPGVHKFADVPPAGSGFIMKSGPGGTPFNEVASRRPPRGLNTSTKAAF